MRELPRAFPQKQVPEDVLYGVIDRARRIHTGQSSGEEVDRSRARSSRLRDFRWFDLGLLEFVAVALGAVLIVPLLFSALRTLKVDISRGADRPAQGLPVFPAGDGDAEPKKKGKEKEDGDLTLVGWRKVIKELWGTSTLPEPPEPMVNPLILHEDLQTADPLKMERKSLEDVSGISPGSMVRITSFLAGRHGGGAGCFRHRGIGGRRRLAMRGGGSRATESAVDAALRWLAIQQEADGRWDCVKYGGKKADVATTGLALLAFLGAGHTEKVGKYKRNVWLAVQWLKSIQHADGKYYINGEVQGIGYHHAIAGLAMAEAAGMARVAATVASAQRAVNYSIDRHQKGEGSSKLGWRYQPKQASNDICVSGWFIMQLKSARVAGLRVDPNAFDGAIRFLDSVERRDADGVGRHRYGYTSPDSVGVRRTAIGCMGRLLLGWKWEQLQGGVEWFVTKGGVPAWGANGRKVDLYYWYFGTLCVFQQGGEVWKRWNEAMKKALLDNQRTGGDVDGSWGPVAHMPVTGGRIGQTALGCMCLEVYYRYLPVYGGGGLGRPDHIRRAPAFSTAEKMAAKQWIQELDDEDFYVREEASRQLKKLGRPALRLLNERLRNEIASPEPSPERILRVKSIIRDM